MTAILRKMAQNETNYAIFTNKAPNATFNEGAVTTGIANFGGQNNTYQNNIGIQHNTGPQNSSNDEIDPDKFRELVEKLLERRVQEDIKFLSDKREKEKYEDALESMVRNKNPDDLPTFKKLITSTGMIKDPFGGHGTIFLAEVDGVGPCLFSAGHVFKGIINDNEVEQTEEGLQNYKIFFGDIEGNFPDSPEDKLEKGKPMRLKVFLEEFGIRGSIQFGGARILLKWDNKQLTTDFKDTGLDAKTDYFAILLDKKIKSNLDHLGLDILDCGTGDQLKHKPGEALMIQGYPAHAFPKGSGKYPRRISYGTENSEGSIQRLIQRFSNSADSAIGCNYDSLPGNSGSPVLGEHYKVKGIHVRGGGKENKMQKITDIKTWINGN